MVWSVVLFVMVIVFSAGAAVMPGTPSGFRGLPVGFEAVAPFQNIWSSAVLLPPGTGTGTLDSRQRSSRSQSRTPPCSTGTRRRLPAPVRYRERFFSHDRQP